MIFSLREVTKSYPTRGGVVRSLCGVSFDVTRGERVAILGPSGAGKTTIFRLLNATVRPSGGAIVFDGAEVGAMSGSALRAMRRRIGTIFQLPQLVPSLTALENTLCGRLGYWSLAHTLRSAIRPRESERDEALATLARVGLLDKQGARADELSGGQQQRLAIARVLMQSPDVILADEPFASLDPGLAESMAALLLSLVADGRRTLVTTLHDTELALRHFPRIIAVREGGVAFDLPAADVTQTMLTALYAPSIRPGVAPEEAERASEEQRRGPAAPPVCAR